MARRRRIRRYVNKHYISWLKYAWDEGYEVDTLLFMSGFSKAQNWLVVSFKEESADDNISLHSSIGR
jgi:hypothetical protein